MDTHTPHHTEAPQRHHSIDARRPHQTEANTTETQTCRHTLLSSTYTQRHINTHHTYTDTHTVPQTPSDRQRSTDAKTTHAAFSFTPQGADGHVGGSEDPRSAPRQARVPHASSSPTSSWAPLPIHQGQERSPDLCWATPREVSLPGLRPPHEVGTHSLKIAPLRHPETPLLSSAHTCARAHTQYIHNTQNTHTRACKWAYVRLQGGSRTHAQTQEEQLGWAGLGWGRRTPGCREEGKRQRAGERA